MLLQRLLGSFLNLAVHLAPAWVGGLGYRLFSSPVAPKLKPHQLAFLQTGNRLEFKLRNGTMLAGYKWGFGPKTLLLLHGWQSHAFWWRYVIPALDNSRYTIIAPDAPAHGQSGGKLLNLPIYADALEDVIQKLGPIDCILGHSMGAFAAMLMLHRHPAAPVGALVAMAIPTTVADYVKYFGAYLGLSQKVISACDAYFIKHLGHPAAYYQAAHFAASLRLPGLLVHDRQDADAPFSYAQKVHAAWPQAQFIATEGLGHNLKSKELVQEVVAWLEKMV